MLAAAVLWSIGVGLHGGGRGWGQLGVWLTYGAALEPWALLVLVTANAGIWLQDVVMFLGLNPDTGQLYFTRDFRQSVPQLHTFLLVPQAWTIAVELTFYLAAPFVVRRRLRAIAGLLAASLVLRLVLYRTGFNHDPWTYRFFPAEVAFFLGGVLAYRLYRAIEPWITGMRAVAVACWLGVIAFTIGFAFCDFPGRSVSTSS